MKGNLFKEGEMILDDCIRIDNNIDHNYIQVMRLGFTSENNSYSEISKVWQGDESKPYYPYVIYEDDMFSFGDS